MKQETATKKKVAAKKKVFNRTPLKKEERSPSFGKSRPRRAPLDFSHMDEVARKINESFVITRQELGMSGEAFAEALGVKYYYIKAVEQGRFTPSHPVIIAFSIKFKRSLDWIYGLYR